MSWLFISLYKILYKFEVLFSCPNSLMVRKSPKQFLNASKKQTKNHYSEHHLFMKYSDSFLLRQCSYPKFFSEVASFFSAACHLSQVGGKIQIFTNFFHGDMNNPKELLDQISLYIKIHGVLQKFWNYFKSCETP